MKKKNTRFQLQMMKQYSESIQGNPFGPERSDDIKEASQKRPNSTERVRELSERERPLQTETCWDKWSECHPKH